MGRFYWTKIQKPAHTKSNNTNMSYQTITLGCPELPLPCRDPITGNLGAVRHFQIKSRLNPTKAIGELYRNYPPFSLTHTFLKMLKYASETVDKPGASPLLALIGEKSAGKTSSATLAMTLVDGVPPETFDCGDKSLDDLLFEAVISDPSKSVIDTLQEKFNAGDVNPVSKRLIESEISYATYQDENGRTKVDFSLIDSSKIKQAVETINTIVKLEGIGNVNGIGLTYKEGPLIRAWKQAEKNERDGVPSGSGRIIIDEIDKRTPGTGKSLQQVFLVLQGLLDKHTVSKNGIEFTFDRSKMPKGFSAVITGNDDRDLAESAGLSQSQASRMTILSIDKVHVEDLTQRICQSLCGMSLLVAEILPDKDKWRILQNLRTLGQDSPLTEEDAWLLKNYEKTLTAARQAAGLYMDWEKIVDPENPEIDDPILEATSAFREPPGVRMAQRAVQRAKANDLLEVTTDSPHPSSNPLEALLGQDTAASNPLTSLGIRWERVVLEDIQLSAGGPETKAKILEAAKVRGFVYEPDEESNPNKHRKLIRHLLATDKEEFVVTKEAKALQAKLYKEFIESHKEIFKGKIPTVEELIPSRDLQAALTQLKDLADVKTSDQTTYILNINPEYIEGNKTAKAIECIPVLFSVNTAHYEKIKSMSKEELHKNMVDTDTFLTLVEAPKIGEDTVDALWNEGWKKELNEIVSEGGYEEGDETPECVKMLAGSSKDLRVCKVLTRSKAGLPEPLLILDSQSTKNTWILREKGVEGTTKRASSLEGLGGVPDKDEGVAPKETKKKDQNDHQIHIVPGDKITELVETLRDILPEACISDLSAVMAAYQVGAQTSELEAAIEGSLKTRYMRNIKVPMRIEDPAALNSTGNSEQKANSTSSSSKRSYRKAKSTTPEPATP
jgi:hypothetical protein